MAGDNRQLGLGVAQQEPWQSRHQHDFYGRMICEENDLRLARFDHDEADALRLLAPANAGQFCGKLVHVRGIHGSCGTLIAWSIEAL